MHADWAWELLGAWASLLGWVTLADVAIATVLLFDYVDVIHWAVELEWFWTEFFVATDAHLLEDWLATFTWSWNKNLVGGHPDVTLAASSLELVVNWTLRWIADAVVLGTAYLANFHKHLAWSVTSWWFWTVLWSARTDLVEASAAFEFITLTIGSDWNILKPVDRAVGKVLTVTLDWFSAAIWVALASEGWAALRFGSVPSSSSGWIESVVEYNGPFALDAIQLIVHFDGHFTPVWLTNAVSASTQGLAINLKTFPTSAVNHRLVVFKWIASIVVGVTLSNWTALGTIGGVKDERLKLAKTAWLASDAFCTVLGYIDGAFGSLAPSVLTATHRSHTASERVSGWAVLDDLWARDWLFEDLSSSARSAIASHDTANIIARVPPLTDGSCLAVAIGTDWAFPLVDALVTLEYLSVWTEAALLGVINESEHVVEVVPVLILASLDVVWSASLPFLVSITSTNWTLAVVDDTPSSEEGDKVGLSPVVSADTSLARTFLGKFVDGLTTSEHGVLLEPSSPEENILKDDLVGLLANDTNFLVTNVEVVEWIDNASAIVEVWIGKDSPALLGVVQEALWWWAVVWMDWNVLALADGVTLADLWLSGLPLGKDGNMAILWFTNIVGVVVGTAVGFNTFASDLWTCTIIIRVIVEDWLVVVWTVDDKWWAWLVWAHTESPVTSALLAHDLPGQIVSFSVSWAALKLANRLDASPWAVHCEFVPVHVTHTDSPSAIVIVLAEVTDWSPDSGVVDTVWLASEFVD